MSIELEKVICNNFLTFGENVTIPLNKKGITLILGELDGDSNQSNGAGKSSILSAITFAWFGKCTRGRSADSVVNRFANENCFVELHWKEGSDQYVVRRSRKLKGTKPNDLVMYKNGQELTRTTATETQAVIDSEVGISYEAFLALMPGTNKLAEMSDAEIKKLIESILGLHKYAQAYDKCKEKLSSVRKQLEIEEAYLTSLKARKEQSKENISALKQLQASQDSITKDKIAAINKELKLAMAASEKLLFSKPTAVEAVAKPSYVTVSTARTEKEKALAALNQFEKRAAVLIAQLETDAGSLLSQKNSITALDTCPTCLSKITEEYKEQVSNTLSVESAKKLEEISVLRKKLSKLRDKQVALLEQAIKALATAEESFREEEARYELYQEYATRLAEWKANCSTANAKIQQLKADLSREAAPAVNQDEHAIAMMQKEFEQLSVSIATQETTVQQLVELKDKYEFWLEAFSAKGIRTKILEPVIPFMNERARVHAQTLANGKLIVSVSTVYQQKSKKIVDDFNIKLKMANGGDSWDAFSTGERARASTILSLTLGDLAAARSGKTLNFLSIDEVLDPVDAHGATLAVNLLDSLKDKYSTVFLVTHKESLQSLFEQRLVLCKDGSFTKLK